jgi:hypothetical protein
VRSIPTDEGPKYGSALHVDSTVQHGRRVGTSELRTSFFDPHRLQSSITLHPR